MMWTTTLGNVGLTRKTHETSEALAAYVRAEYGERDTAWFLAEIRRAAKKSTAPRLLTWDALPKASSA